jgi:FkbM family methyltransferase
VHSFEPSADTRARLEQAIRLNGLQNVRVHSWAVGPERTEAALYDAGRSAQASLRPGGREGGRSRPVQVRTVSDLWHELGPPDVIKIDAEGAEVGIVEGGARVLAEAAVSLLVEVHNEKSAEQILQLVPAAARDRIGATHWVLRLGRRPSPST